MTEDDLYQTFTILHFNRMHLIEAGIPREQVETLTDEDMVRIANELRSIYNEGGYKDNLHFYACFYLVFKDNPTNAVETLRQQAQEL